MSVSEIPDHVEYLDEVKPSYVMLDADGKIVASDDPHRRQVMASTTKMVFFDYILTLVDEGQLSERFLQDNEKDIARMMLRSSNQATRKVRDAALEELGIDRDEFFDDLNLYVDKIIQESGVDGHSSGADTFIGNVFRAS